jgi:hypothetical protein
MVFGDTIVQYILTVYACMYHTAEIFSFFSSVSGSSEEELELCTVKKGKTQYSRTSHNSIEMGRTTVKAPKTIARQDTVCKVIYTKK